jgi:hypothetical protein
MQNADRVNIRGDDMFRDECLFCLHNSIIICFTINLVILGQIRVTTGQPMDKSAEILAQNSMMCAI